MIEVIDKAVDAGIPVVTFNADSPKSKRATLLAFDEYATGKAAALVAASLINDSGEVAILSTSIRGNNIINREKGFVDEIKNNHPNMKVVTQTAADVANNIGASDSIQCVPGPKAFALPLDASVVACRTKFEKTLADNPNVKLWYFHSGWLGNIARQSAGTIAVWEDGAKSGKFITIGFDALQEAIPYVSDGRIRLLYNQKLWDFGAKSIQALYDMTAKGEAAKPFIDLGIDRVCKSNAAVVEAAWTSFQFLPTLPACEP